MTFTPKLAIRRELIERADKAGIKASLHDSQFGVMIVHPDGKHEVSWFEFSRIVAEAEALKS